MIEITGMDDMAPVAGQSYSMCGLKFTARFKSIHSCDGCMFDVPDESAFCIAAPNCCISESVNFIFVPYVEDTDGI